MTQIKTIFSIIYTFLSKNTIKKLLFFYNTNVNIQWGKIQLSNSNKEEIRGPYYFPIGFSTQCFLVLPTMGNNDQNNWTSYDSLIQQRSWNNTQFWIVQQIVDARPWFSWGNYITIGF